MCLGVSESENFTVSGISIEWISPKRDRKQKIESENALLVAIRTANKNLPPHTLEIPPLSTNYKSKRDF